MLIHGEQDEIVPIAQSKKMRSALKTSGKEVEFVKLGDDNHFLEKNETRLEALTRTVEFVNRYIGQ